MGRLIPWIGVGFLLPSALALALVVWAALQAGSSIELAPDRLSIESLETVAAAPQWQRGFADSFRIAIPAAVLSLVIGSAAAFGLQGLNSRWRGLLLNPILLPLLVPPLLLAVGWFPVFQRFGLYDSYLGIAMLHAALAVPLVVLPVFGGLRRIGAGPWQAAASLGIPPLTCARALILPALTRELTVAFTLALLFSLNETAISLFFSALHVQPLVQLLWSGVRFELSPKVFAAVCWLLLLEATLIVVLRLAFRRKRHD